MIGLFGQDRDARHKAERFNEVGEDKLARQRITRFIIVPLAQRIERSGAFLFVELFDHLCVFLPPGYVASMTGTGQIAPTARDIETLARAAMVRLPDPFAALAHNVVLVVTDFADDEILTEMGIESPFDLSGLYSGRPIGQPPETGDLPPTVHLFRRPILDEWCESGETLDHLVAHIVIHEIGHHMGLSDAVMHALEAAAE